jgi:hypothetical protein
VNLTFARLRRPPLPITAGVTLLLVLLPSLGLTRWPRPRAQGLEQLIVTSSLLQSFPAAPQRPVPELWKGRLGAALAQRLWRRQRRSWWQFWGSHEEAAPYLALPAAGLPAGSSTPLPPNSLRVGNLLVVAPDPLSRQLLEDRLKPKRRPTRGLQRRCLPQLEQGQAVLWNPSALGVIAGPVAVFLQRFQEGCLSLSIDPGGVRWSGEAAAVEGVFLEKAPAPALVNGAPQAPLPKDLLLELTGPDLQLLFEGLLSRQVIRDPLETVYGIDKTTLALMRSAPFRLRLRSQPQGPFQASLELQLETGTKRAQWEAALGRLAEVLKDRGLRGSPSASLPPPAKVPSPAELPATSQPPSPSAPPERHPCQGTPGPGQRSHLVEGGWRGGGWMALDQPRPGKSPVAALSRTRSHPPVACGGGGRSAAAASGQARCPGGPGSPARADARSGEAVGAALVRGAARGGVRPPSGPQPADGTPSGEALSCCRSRRRRSAATVSSINSTA